jgi:hypothetical protein
LSIFAYRRRSAALEGAQAASADGLGRYEPDRVLAALTNCVDALSLDMREKFALRWSVNIPVAEIVFIYGGHPVHFPRYRAWLCARRRPCAFARHLDQERTRTARRVPITRRSYSRISRFKFLSPAHGASALCR